MIVPSGQAVEPPTSPSLNRATASTLCLRHSVAHYTLALEQTRLVGRIAAVTRLHARAFAALAVASSAAQ